MEREAAAVPFIDRGTGDVGGQQVAGELNPLKFQPQALGEAVREGGLADPRNIFKQQVTLGQQAGDGLANLVCLAEDDLGHLIDGLMQTRDRTVIAQGRQGQIESIRHGGSGTANSNEVFGRGG